MQLSDLSVDLMTVWKRTLHIDIHKDLHKRALFGGRRRSVGFVKECTDIFTVSGLYIKKVDSFCCSVDCRVLNKI